MSETQALLAQIDHACRRLKMAQSTFGRLAVNDGKLVQRLQQGGRVTMQTMERVHRFIEAQDGASANALRSGILGLRAAPSPAHNFRFYDNRQKYLMFVNTTNEKQIIADRALQEMAGTQPVPPAIRLFDGGAGDGTALARIMRGLHRRHPWVPFYVVAKEISAENIRMTLEKMPDRLREHAGTVLVLTNLKYCEAPTLQPETPSGASAMVWHEVALDGNSAGEFEEQITALEPFIARHWQASIASSSGNPVYKTPVVLVIYRRDHGFMLDPIVPRRGYAKADFDFALLSQPYRAHAPIEFKASRVVAPLVRALRANGKMMGVHSHGNDPGMEIIRSIWPEEDPFQTDRGTIMEAVKQDLGLAARDYHFHDLPDSEALFRYDVRTLPTEVDASTPIGSSTLFAAWNAASYVAQIEDGRFARALSNDHYLEATRAVLQRHRGLWFNDELYLISRRARLA
ncbi:hypothetical protein ACFO8O_15015 [Hephaestia sp. GCM10023244]|uniref:hypothetical protein n=1 Tax=unclassified Hephaestia TaxID=2631281 RepID=UPI002077831A|nr:hypothetical protein [Hephaestia sp. MAHUQ-44]MCM8732272.1 hypothetical protein [Hephaestia sp. MAHUQ-44]